MSFGDLYTLRPGEDIAPGLPPVALPGVQVAEAQPRARIRIPVPISAPEAPVVGRGVIPGGAITPAADSFAGFEEYKPPGEAKGKAPAAAGAGADFAGFEPYKGPEAAKPEREVSTAEAFGRGAADVATLGTAPAIAGLAEAGGGVQDVVNPETGVIHERTIGELMSPLRGAWGLIQGDPQAREAYHRGREQALKDQDLAQSQHKVAYMLGQLTGGFFGPQFVPGRGGGLGQRMARGGLEGAIQGGTYAAGRGISEAKDPLEVAGDIATGGVVGGAGGAVLGGILGPRVPGAGSQAARTAADLGAPLPRGLASESGAVRAITSHLQGTPIAGRAISGKVERVREAAGERIGDIAGEMQGAARDRAAANAVAASGLGSVIRQNKAIQDAGYDAVRSQIDTKTKYQLPRLQAALQRVVQERANAHWEDPWQGLDQFRRAAQGTNYEGVHRVRMDMRSKGTINDPHPGFDKNDFNLLTRAMTEDMRDLVATTARGSPRRAVEAFDRAEAEFGRLAEVNKQLAALRNAKGESAIGTLIGAAKEKGGNFKLINDLRRSMHPDQFAVIGGTLLHELGQGAGGEFSLAKFATNWSKVSDRAKTALFTPQHARQINDIVEMATNLRGALSETNVSKTAHVLTSLAALGTAGTLGYEAATTGDLKDQAVSTLASGATIGGLTLFLGMPKNAAATSAFLRAFNGLLTERTPIRIAAFNMATRNLANNTGIPVDRIIGAARTAAEQPDTGNKQPK